LTVTQQPVDLFRAFAELGRIKLGETDLSATCRRVAEMARRTLPGADDAGMTVMRSGRDRVAAGTSRRAEALDGAGPVLDAATEQVTVRVIDTATERRWSTWPERAASAGIRSVLAVGLPVDDKVTGAITVYSETPKAFDDDAITLTQTFAGYASVAVANVHLYDTTVDLAEHMRRAMEHRAVIEQAKGVIMAERRCTPEQAFAMLTKLSQDSNRKLRDVAAALVARSAGSADAPRPTR
jgi:GAF domain-containing protein